MAIKYPKSVFHFPEIEIVDSMFFRNNLLDDSLLIEHKNEIFLKAIMESNICPFKVTLIQLPEHPDRFKISIKE